MAGGVDGLAWVREADPTWDADKQRVIGGAPEGTFVLPFGLGEELPGEWWAARAGSSDGEVVGYGRLDIGWGGDAEILLAVDPACQERGVGSFMLEHLEAEAVDRGINYVYNTIRDHAGNDMVHDWLVVRGFRGPLDGDLRKRVGRGSGAAVDEKGERSTYSRRAGDPSSDRAPGHEEQGGYVDVEDHQY